MSDDNEPEHTRQVAREINQQRIERVARAKASAPADKEPLDLARVKREARTGALGRMGEDELAIKLEDLYYFDHPRYRTNQELIDLINLFGHYE